MTVRMVSDEVSEKVLSRVVGEELRRAREACGWSRGYLVARLPSGIGDRTLLSYEHGTRHLTVLRFIELCRAMGVSAPQLLGSGLQRARVHLDNLALRVDLRALLADDTAEFRQMTVWAHNKLIEYPAGVVEIVPAGVRELAAFMGLCTRDLAAYFARFTPEPDEISDHEDDRSLVRNSPR